MAVGILTAFALGLLTMKALQPAPQFAKVVFDGQVMSGERPLEVPGLRELVDGDDARGVAAYFETNRERLALMFNETNEARLRGLFGMYLVHVSQPYGSMPSGWEQYTLSQFLQADEAHCGGYALMQGMIYTALGLRWNNVIVDGSWHGLIEAEIDGAWETFDATTNVWASISVGGLIGGLPREYRQFYTPVWDMHADDIYRQHYVESDGYNSVPDIRAGLPQWGISVHPTRWVINASG
jgi:hypothetical protein